MFVWKKLDIANALLASYREHAKEDRDRKWDLGRKLEAAREQLAFLERVLDRQRGPARVAACGVPKKAQGPLVQRVLFASRDEAALLVPGVKHDSVGYVGHFEWGADYVEVHVRDDKKSFWSDMLKEDW